MTDPAACAAHAERLATFTCERCGDFACDDCAFWPGAPVMRCRSCAREGLAEPIPWERRKELGMLRAAWRTGWLVLKSPRELFRTPSILPAGSGEPVLFAMLVYGVAMFAMFALLGLAGVGSIAVSLAGGEAPADGLVVGLVVAIVYPLVGAVLGPVTGLSYAALSAGLNWLGLRIAGERHAYAPLLRAEAYSSGVYVLSALPLLGIYVANLVKVFYTDVVAVREAAGVATGKAVFALWVPRLLLLTLCGVPYALLIIGLAAAGGLMGR